MKKKERQYGVGGLWDEIGKLQFNYLVSKGLKPEHYLLDIGCGALRGGVHFIGYLNQSHYYGFDNRESVLEAGRNIEIPNYKLKKKNAQLFNISDFNISGFDVEFNFMLAQSIFPHLQDDGIKRCISSVMPKLKSGGVFYATIFVQTLWKVKKITQELNVDCQYVGDWEHPRDQRMLALRKRKNPT